MITLTNGHIQTPGASPEQKCSISFQLNQDATVVAGPGGLVPASLILTFQLDANGNIQSGAQIYSNAELSPSGTYYKVAIYDANGARLNSAQTYWQFEESTGATVDISQMTPFNPS